MKQQQTGAVPPPAIMFMLYWYNKELIACVYPQVLLRGQKEPLVITVPLVNRSM